VRWAVDRQPIPPCRVSVCPPDVYMELRPEGTAVMRAMEPMRERRFDVLLTSAAASYGPRALAGVLSGSRRDGAVGTPVMKRAGGTVTARSPQTAEYASMPLAAAEAGADAVLPVSAIGPVLVMIASSGIDTSVGLTGLLDDLGIAHKHNPSTDDGDDALG